MIPGTSKIWSKSGPGTLLTITKILQKNTRNIWNHLGQILFIIYNKTSWTNVRENVCPRYHMFRCFRFRFEIFVFFWVHILKIFLWRWGSKMTNLPLMKFTKAWEWISYLSKNMKWKFDKFLCQVRESLNKIIFKEGPLHFLFSRKGIIKY